MYKLLSYILSEQTPLYGDIAPIKIRHNKNMANNDTSNRATITFCNHSGTHIDAPKHFYKDGKAIGEYSIEELIFHKPQIINCPKKENELVKTEELKGILDCDLLLIRTGFFKFRQSDIYRLNNPGISSFSAEWLRRKHPHIKAIGIDSISVSSFPHREEGRRTHQILLAEQGYPGGPMLLIEDMDLSFNNGKLLKVYVVPLMLEGVDSMPCSVIGEYE
ncbi:MAG: cyclase family protein [bacterium]